MEKLSEYIPFLIILGTVLFSLFGKKKKPNVITQKTTLPGETAGESVDEEKLLRPKSGLIKKILNERTKKPALDKPEMVKKKEIISSFSTEDTFIETEEDDTNLSFSFDERDDIVKAVIYSEIINRKEY